MLSKWGNKPGEIANQALPSAPLRPEQRRPPHCAPSGEMMRRSIIAIEELITPSKLSVIEGEEEIKQSYIDTKSGVLDVDRCDEISAKPHELNNQDLYLQKTCNGFEI